jgi:hypothetical protein
MIGEYIYYFSKGMEVNEMLTSTHKTQEEQKKRKDTQEEHRKARKLSHEAAASMMDHEWKHHPGGG